MRNPNSWKTSKFILKKGRLIPSLDRAKLGVGSRLTAGRIAAFYAQAIPEHARGKLIDLGCGKIPLYPLYIPHTEAILCTDWRISLPQSQYLDFTCNLADILPLSAETFDTIILADVLEHIPNPQGLWNEMNRILTPGGKLLLTVPFYYGIHEAPHDYHRFTEFALRRYASEAGFPLLELEPLGGSPEVLADLLGKHLSAIPLIGAFLAILLQSLVQVFTTFGPGKKFSHISSRAFPLGYALVAVKLHHRQLTTL